MKDVNESKTSRTNETASSISDLDQQLLLYAWDELPADRRAAIERRLKSEPELRAQADALRATRAATEAMFSAADALDPIDVRVRGMERSTSRLLKQWQVDRLTQKTGDSANAARTRFRRVPLWMFPLSAAAAVLLVLGVWSLVLRSDSIDPPGSSPIAQDDDEGEDDADNRDANATIGQLAIAAAPSWNPLSDVGNSGEIDEMDREFARLEVLHYTLR
jgi:hypothetical protein